MPRRLLQSCMLQILSALAFCHARLVLHRDLKPQNVRAARPRKSPPARPLEAPWHPIWDPHGTPPAPYGTRWHPTRTPWHPMPSP